MSYRVTLTACVAGNPLKAWFGTTGPDDTEHVPNDVWQDFDLPFDDLDAAKGFIRGLHPDTSTHVVLYGTGDDGEQVLYRQDSGHDDLDEAGVDVVPWSELALLPDVEPVEPEAPPLFVAPS